MKIANSKKLAGCLVNEATCRKKLGKEIADSLFKLMNQLRKIVDVRQLFELPGNWRRGNSPWIAPRATNQIS